MRNRILVIDRDNARRKALADVFSKDYVVDVSSGVTDAMNMINNIHDSIALVLMDVLDSDWLYEGYEFLEKIGKTSFAGNFPIIAICSSIFPENLEKMYELGVTDCICRPFGEKILRLKVGNVVHMFQYREKLEAKIEDQTKKLKMQNSLLKSQADFLEKSNKKIIDLMGTMAEYRDQESGEHIQRMKVYIRIIAEDMMREFPQKNLTPEKIAVIVSASPLHDIGKIAISDTILLKPGRLDEKEFECMKAHTIYGSEIIAGMKGAWNDEYAKVSMEICRSHHERYDGRGYPDGLAGDNIPLSAQIVSVADVYDALVHERVYKAAIPEMKAYDMIENGECGVFSPELMHCLTDCREKLKNAL